MYLVIAALVQRFTFEPRNVTARDFELERDNFGIGIRAGCNLMAHVNLHKTSKVFSEKIFHSYN